MSTHKRDISNGVENRITKKKIYKNKYKGQAKINKICLNFNQGEALLSGKCSPKPIHCPKGKPSVNGKYSKTNRFNFEINLLVNLYYMEKGIKSSFPELSIISKSKFYLIDKKFIENFKKQFNYEYIQSYLEKGRNNLENDILIMDLSLELSQNEKLCNEIEKNKNKIIPHKYEYFYKKTINNTFQFLRDYEIINNKLYKLFNESNYLKDNMKKVNVYKINDNKILVLYNSEKIYDQLGYIG